MPENSNPLVPSEEPPIGSRIWWSVDKRTPTGRIAGIAWGHLAIRMESGWIYGDGGDYQRWTWEELTSRDDFLGGCTEFVVLPSARLQLGDAV